MIYCFCEQAIPCLNLEEKSMHIFADQIKSISLSNMNLRVELSQRAAENEIREVGTLIIPVNQANNFANALTNGLKQLEEKIKAQAEKQNSGQEPS
jgi:ABC-type hemin transport system substrate-binding protein